MRALLRRTGGEGERLSSAAAIGVGGGVRRRWYFALAAIILLLDQLTKEMIRRTLPLYEAREVLPGFFSISHVLNKGAAFSMFAEGSTPLTRAMLIVFSLAVIGVIVYLLASRRAAYGWLGWALALILGGACGNLIDRLLNGSVTDFLAFQLGSYHWPDFNLADSAIVAGSLLLVIESFRGGDKAASPGESAQRSRP